MPTIRKRHDSLIFNNLMIYRASLIAIRKKRHDSLIFNNLMIYRASLIAIRKI